MAGELFRLAGFLVRLLARGHRHGNQGHGPGPQQGKESKTGDYQAVIKYARDKDGYEYVEADMGKRPVTAMQAPDGTELSEGMCETLIDNAREFKPEGIGIEGNQFQELLVIPLKDVAKTAAMTGNFGPTSSTTR